MKGGQSRDLGSRESQYDGVEERKDMVDRAKAGTSFFPTRSRWPRALKIN